MTCPPVPGVVVVGSLNRDYVCTVDRLPGRGETRLGTELTLWCGGKGGNQAVAAALSDAGVRVAMVGAVGDDDDGRVLLDGLRAAGVDVADVVVRRGVRSGAALVTVADDGDNTIVVAPGANLTVSEDEVRAALGRRDPAVVVVQGELPAPVVAAAVREAARLGARPILNLAPVIPVPDAVVRSCDPLLVNAGEAGAVLGRAVTDAAELESAARDLSGRARSVVVTGGALGAWVGEGGRVSHVPARPAAVVDTTGAGDAFTGALAAVLAQGHALVDAAERGAVVAAHAIGRPGAQASFPRGSDLGPADYGPIP